MTRKVKVIATDKAADPTVNNLMVGSTTSFTNEEWDRQRVVDKLVTELGVKPETADTIAQAVEVKLADAGLETVTTAEVRTLIQAELLARGMRAKFKKGNLAVMSFHDLESLMVDGNQENSNVPHNPEAINLYIGENIVKQFALDSGRVFSPDVATAHKDGYIHLHDLGLIERPYCSGNSPAFVIRHGLSSKAYVNPSKPAKHILVLINHIKEFSSLLQGHFAGAIGWDAVNTFLSPFAVGLTDEQIMQAAQDMIFSFSQLLGTRGGQAIFSDLNFYYEVPRRYRNTFALGKGGKFIRRVRDKYGEVHDELVDDLPKNPVMFRENNNDGFLTYQDFELEARRLLKAIIKVYRGGDANGMPFFFPKANVHITQDFWRTSEHAGFLELMAEAASANGSLYFVMERGDTNVISQCCRLRVNMTQEELDTAHKEPWRMRFAALQNITINMPRLAIEAARVSKDMQERKSALLQSIDKFMHVAVDAHLQKKKFISKLLALKEHGPLAALTYDQDGAPYFNLNSSRYLIGVIGLNETVQAICGKQLHESKVALEIGLEIVSFMYMNCRKLGAEAKINLALEQTPAESTAYRFAKLDFDKYTEAKELVKGDLKSGSIYYTNSTHMAADAKLGIIDRITMEGLFHGAIDAGSITHGFIGDSTPNTEAMATFIRKIYDLTSNDQVVFSPTFTRCNSCDHVHKGEVKECPDCKSTDVTLVTRVTGYYGEVDKWNKGKQQEREDRVQHTSLVEKEGFSVVQAVEDIVLYGKVGCSICESTNEVVKNLLKKPEFGKITYRYEVIDQDKTFEASAKLAEMLSKNVRDIPALVIHDRSWAVKMPTAATIEHVLQSLGGK